ncbi:hypothetical protein A2917_02260 [Candidatus Nomurabacteria bacterium RIFCSPLOWO2_01_FULL_42_17]|uniref:Collagen-like protein n=1 Tax=Candidatus Nomurabacteria bacterium RIFCSPLOWO2_01_FULL_42_17 TaxID=1801780 RepID=A0A1F6XMI0_9BACT|nr:MAG: hypothetical protein A2917_02260 [Candidatus Nomurabacteria bacterium RIFCSPLOWO2_01_FULL_42_17]
MIQKEFRKKFLSVKILLGFFILVFSVFSFSPVKVQAVTSAELLTAFRNYVKTVPTPAILTPPAPPTSSNTTKPVVYVAGPQGPQGPMGPQGIQGPAGPRGGGR